MKEYHEPFVSHEVWEKSALEKAGFHSRLIFSWASDLVEKGYRQRLNNNDLDKIPKEFDAEI